MKDFEFSLGFDQFQHLVKTNNCAYMHNFENDTLGFLWSSNWKNIN